MYFLLRLPGDQAEVRYTAGSLDRAANVQTRLEVSARAWDGWVNHELDYSVYVMSREEWETAAFPVVYGMPIRIGHYGIATAAIGDDLTVALWSRLTDGRLPDVAGMPMRGTPAQASSLVLSDLVLQLQAGEILVDDLGIGGDTHWTRGVISHLAAAVLTRRREPRREPSVVEAWRVFTEHRPIRSLAAEDYAADLSLEEWLWFQGHFRLGAMVVLEEHGARRALKKIRKRAEKGRLTASDLLADIDGLDDWYRETFSGVRRR